MDIIWSMEPRHIENFLNDNASDALFGEVEIPVNRVCSLADIESVNMSARFLVYFCKVDEGWIAIPVRNMLRWIRTVAGLLSPVGDDDVDCLVDFAGKFAVEVSVSDGEENVEFLELDELPEDAKFTFKVYGDTCTGSLFDIPACKFVLDADGERYKLDSGVEDEDVNIAIVTPANLMELYKCTGFGFKSCFVDRFGSGDVGYGSIDYVDGEDEDFEDEDEGSE